MPVIEMRESIGSTPVTLKIGESLAVVQKRINLKEGPHQRNMLQMDLFFDNFPVGQGPLGPEKFSGIIEFFVTPTPLILTDMTIQGFPGAGPMASNQLVLFKAIVDGTNVTRFPQDFLATNANFPFFHDQLFITMIFHRVDPAITQEIVDYAASFYMSYKEKKVPAYRAAMGVISERFASMLAKVQTNGRNLRNVTNLAGSFIPAYNWGGIRPELMVTANNITQFFLNIDSQASESMISIGQLKAFLTNSRTMVSNPNAFGKDLPVGGIPDWFSTIVPKGVEAGAIRSQVPPRVTQDNPGAAGLGNILMV